VSHLLEGEHLRRRDLDDKTSRLAFERFIEQLDGGKMFLLKADAAKLEPYADQIDDELHSGRLDLAHEAQAAFVRRLGVVEKLVAELLEKPFNLEDEEFVETDPEKTELCGTEEELRERWRRRLELQVLEDTTRMEERAKALADRNAKKKKPADDDDEDATPQLSADQIPPTPEGREQKARAALAKTYAARFARLSAPDSIDAASNLMNAVASTFDPHTNYLPPRERENFDIHMTGQLEGIGAVLREDDHYIRVVEVVPGGAAWRQGQLEVGDLIQAVQQKGKDPVDVTDMRIDDVVQMIRGPKNTVVTLSVEKPTGDPVTIAITRDVVVIEESFARGAVVQPKGGKRPFGYIYLPGFYGGQGSDRSAAADVKRLLVEMKKRKLAGVVIDMRGNGGGLLDDAVDMTGHLVDRGPVVQTQLGDGNRDILGDDHAGTAYDGAVVVMIDQFSASASEIVAGALQDYKRAVLVGTAPTHGKGTVQVLADLDRLGGGGEDLGSLKLTVQQFFRVSGASTQWQGVVPDITLPNPTAHVESGERSLDNSIPWSQIDPVPHQDWPVSWKLPDLSARSAQRVAKSDLFGKITKRVELLKARRDDTKVPLARAAWLKQREEQRAALEAVTPDMDERAAQMSVTVVNYDGQAAVMARPGKKAEDKPARWTDQLARDPWVEESVLVLQDMVDGGR
jgi:carboxyl-terminal processing protease